MKILVCGARIWTDRETIRAWIERLPAGTIVIHGDCGKRDDRGVAVKGADIMAGDEAIARGLTVRSYPADWSRGRQAGPERNQHMLDVEHVEPHRIARCFAFSWILVRKYISPGTSDMVSRCIDAGIACTIIPPGARP